jgi:hypothetical protein
MAGDLIPPPSPAGRPPPDSMADVRATAHLEEATHLAEEAEGVKAGPAPYRGRFGFVWGALAGIAICVIGLGAFLIASGGNDGPPLAKNWSEWKPSTSRMLPGAEDIAAHVGREYKLDAGDQLAAIRSGEFQISGTPIGVAVRPKGGELEVQSGPGVLYLLSVLSTDPKTTTGKAGRTNERLMMREAVELALYSFRYLDDITMVGIMLPPRTGAAEESTDGAQRTRTLFFRPGDLLDKLEVPLSDTLSAEPPRPKKLTNADGLQIDSLALRNLFLAQIQQLDSQHTYLVLAPPEVID